MGLFSFLALVFAFQFFSWRSEVRLAAFRADKVLTDDIGHFGRADFARAMSTDSTGTGFHRFIPSIALRVRSLAGFYVSIRTFFESSLENSRSGSYRALNVTSRSNKKGLRAANPQPFLRFHAMSRNNRDSRRRITSISNPN